MAKEFEMYDDKQGKWRWRFRADNNEIVAVSEAYNSKAACENGIDAVQREAPGAPRRVVVAPTA